MSMVVRETIKVNDTLRIVVSDFGAYVQVYSKINTNRLPMHGRWLTDRTFRTKEEALEYAKQKGR